MKHLFGKGRRMKQYPTRPATILSPHGEGYCHHCRFVIGLDAQGLMDRHERGVATTFNDNRKVCPGSGRRPHARTPYSAEKNRFTFRPPKGECQSCGVQAGVLTDVYGHEYVVEHARGKATSSRLNGLSWCDGSYRPPA